MVASTTNLARRMVGGSGTTIAAGAIEDLDENSRTTGEKWRGGNGVLGEADKMLVDPHCRSARDAVADPVAGATWEVEAGDDRPASLEAARYVSHQLFEQNSFRQVLARIMRGYIAYGFHLEEITDDVVPVDRAPGEEGNGRGTGIGITGFHHRPAYTVDGWDQSESDPAQIAGVRQWIPGSDAEDPGYRDIPADRLLRFTWEQDAADFEGFPIFRSCWGAWFAKRLLSKIELVAHDKGHQPVPVVTNDNAALQDDDEERKLSKSVRRWRANQDAFLQLPAGYSIELIAGGSGTDIRGTIAALNFDIAHAVAFGWALHGTANTAGSYALASVQGSHYAVRLQKHASFLEDVINTGLDGWSLIDRIVRPNYGDTAARPRLVVRNLPTENWTAVLPLATDAIKHGVMSREGLDAVYRRVMRLPPPPAGAKPTPSVRSPEQGQEATS